MLFHVIVCLGLQLGVAQALTPENQLILKNIGKEAEKFKEQALSLEKQSIKAMQKEEIPNIKPAMSCSSTDPLNGCGSFKVDNINQEKIPYLMQNQKPLIFVSASMPKETLKNLGQEARRSGGVLVIRGLVKGSLINTAKLVDDIHFPLEIDPKLFEKFSIIKVPVFLIYKDGQWHKLSGNVSLAYAQEKAEKAR
jgi:type-F conjugative transfer system pilin assembly protein TrbC